MAESVEMQDDSNLDPKHTSPNKKEPSKLHRGHEITSKTIKAPPFSYACLELVSATNTKDMVFDIITARSYMTSALTQFLGLTGSAISIDTLKLDGSLVWIRVPREDLSPVIAAFGGWVGASDAYGKVTWRVKAKGNWLSVLVLETQSGSIWNE